VMFGRATLDAVRLPYRRFAKPGVRFVKETITAIDPVARRVTTSGGTYEADFLVVALGADYDVAATPGLAEDGHEFYSVAGANRVREVLPAFRRFCEDTVLVGHNAAFDLRFFELKRASSGVRFSQPVLDTLLLSAVAHPALDDHRLEAIAARLGVSVIGRHTALGDALLTGEIFLKLLPLLADRGILTLGQALAASRETYYARLQY